MWSSIRTLISKRDNPVRRRANVEGCGSTLGQTSRLTKPGGERDLADFLCRGIALQLTRCLFDFSRGFGKSTTGPEASSAFA